MRIRLSAALLLAAAAAPVAAETLTPIDAQDPAFARVSRERAPVRAWHTEAERVGASWGKSLRREAQRQLGYRGLVLPGGGRALMAFYEREAIDSLAPAVPGTAALFYRAVDAEGRRGARIAIGATADVGLFLDRGKGEAAVIGVWRDGASPLLSIAADGAITRTLSLKLPRRPLRMEMHGTGYLVWVDFRGDEKMDKGPFHLLRIGGEGRTVWSFEYPRGHYGFVATAARADGFTLAVLNEGPLKGIVQDVAALLLDRAGRRVAKHTLALSGNGGPVPTGLHALRGGGFLLTGFWWGPGGNFVAWLDADGKLVRHADVTLGDFVEVQWILPLGDRGFFGTNAKGELLRFDRDTKLLWRWARPAAETGTDREIEIHDIRVLAGNQLLVAGSRSWFDDAGAEGRVAARGYFVERFRWE